MRLKAAKGRAQKLLKFGVRVCVSPGGRATGLRNTHTERESKNFQRQKLLSL